MAGHSLAWALALAVTDPGRPYLPELPPAPSRQPGFLRVTRAGVHRRPGVTWLPRMVLLRGHPHQKLDGETLSLINTIKLDRNRPEAQRLHMPTDLT